MSGRLSASDGLQTIPSNSVFGKPIKSCFVPPEGWLFCYADFASLEDRINTLLTKDENKVKVYTDGYDGHSIRSVAYFGKQMPDIMQELEEVRKEGRVFKVSLSSGETKYYNEYSPIIQEYLNDQTNKKL